MKLEGKSALVTGAGRGIGRAIALRLAREGADITIADISADNISSVVHEVEALGRHTLGVVTDVSRVSDVEKMVQKHRDTFGRLDILVNNAGIMIVKPLFEFTEEDWDRIFAINLRAIYTCSRIAAPVMIAQKSGKIINTASMGAFIASPHYAAYCAVKAGVVSLTQSMAKELAAYNIQVNAVCPGVIETDMWVKIDQEAGALFGMTRPKEFMMARVNQVVAMKRPGTPDEVAAVFAFLASPDSDYVTGQAYNVNGGMFAG